jgi:phosphoserine/homoserine phosphotransferase
VQIVCLDLEGVLVPEIWIEFAERTGIPELRRTTRDEPDYDKLMKYRLDILADKKLGLPDIQKVIAEMGPMPGAREFVDGLREDYQVIILSDTFYEFAHPLMRQLGWPTLFCHSLEADANGVLVNYHLRMADQKREAVKRFKEPWSPPAIRTTIRRCSAKRTAASCSTRRRTSSASSRNSR